MTRVDTAMVAAVVRRYGPPETVTVETLPIPVPGPDQVLVKVEASAVTSGDARIRGARFPRGFGLFARAAFGVRGPRRQVLGNTFAGTVVSFGGPKAVAAVGGLRVGDAVCGMTGTRMGAHATHVVVAASKVVPTPDRVTHEEAAGLLFGATTAAHFLGRADDRLMRSRTGVGIGPGTSVLVIGASGAVGTNAVQLAAARGAMVTGVCSAGNSALVYELGAFDVLDRAQLDPSSTPHRFDVVLDTVGEIGIGDGRRLLTPGGVLLLVAAGLRDTIRARGDVVAGPAPERTDDMAALLTQVAEGTLRVVIDEVLALDGIVEAYRRVDSGHKVGNLVLRTDPTRADVDPTDLDGAGGDA